MAQWLLTDDATGQHVRKLSDGRYGKRYGIIDSVAFPDGHGFVSQRTIDLSDYEMDEDFCRSYLHPYGYDNQEDVIAQYGGSGWQIIAECIAETEIWERECIVFEGTHKQCLRYIDELVRRENLEDPSSGHLGNVRRRRRRGRKRRGRRAPGSRN